MRGDRRKAGGAVNGNKVIEYVIAAKDRTASAVRSALSRIRSFAAGVGKNLMNIKAGFDMVKGVVQTFASAFATAIREAFRFEKATADFKVLLGSIDAAKAHIEDLKKFAASTPLTFGDLSKASKLLLSFGASVEDVMPAMKMLGDIAMGDSQKFQGLALVFAQVKSAGKLMGQDLLQMINQGFNPLTVISQQTGRSVSELKDMMAEGSISFEMVAEAMRVATSEGGLFANAMEESAKTGEGLVSTLQDNWDAAVREFGSAFSDASKGGVQQLIDKLSELNENGTIEEWAKGVAHWFSAVVDGAKTVAGWISAIYKYSGLADAVNLAQGIGKGAMDAVGGAVGAIAGGGGIGDAWRSARENFNSAVTTELAEDGFWLKDANEAFGRKLGWIVDKPTAKKKAKKAVSSKTSETTGGGMSLSDMFAEAEAKALEAKEAEAAKKAREKELADAERLAKELAKEEERMRLEAERAIAAERDRLQRRTLDEYRKGLEAAQAASSDAQARLAAAQANERQAWGWYRDRDSWKAQIEEERADAKAQVQFEKDLDRLKYRRDWRTATLSDDDEVVRRVAFAREEKAAAEGYARQTAECAARAAEALERIQDEMEGC